jgi:hypothetical protein
LECLKVNNTFWYSVKGFNGRFKFPFNPACAYNYRAVAAEAAENFHIWQAAGEEATWPIVISLYESKEGPAVCSFVANFKRQVQYSYYVSTTEEKECE